MMIEESRQMMESIGCINIRIEHHDLEMDLETILESSFPKPGDKDRIVQLFKQDLAGGSFRNEKSFNK